MLSRSFQELELISTSAELLAAQCHFITFLMHTLAKITLSVKKKKGMILFSALDKKVKSCYITLRQFEQEISNIPKCPEDVEENLLKRGSFIAAFLKSIPLFMQIDLTTVCGLFQKCLMCNPELSLKDSAVYYCGISGCNIQGATM